MQIREILLLKVLGNVGGNWLAILPYRRRIAFIG